MAFGKKKKANADASPAVETPVQEAPSKKRRRSPMASIFHESVFETVLDDLRNNEQFIQTVDGVKRYIGIVLDTKDIGGLDKKSRKNEAKGSIIECINSGRIKTYITPELMDLDSLVIIPEPMTLAAMDEFSDLTDAPYEFCAIDDSGNIELLGIRTTYGAVSDLVGNDGHINSLLPVGDEDDEEDEVEDDESDLVDDNSASDLDEDSGSTGSLFDDEDEIPDIEGNEDDDLVPDDSGNVPPEDMANDVPDMGAVDDTGSIGGVDPNMGYNPPPVADGTGVPAEDPYAAAMEDQPVDDVEEVIPEEFSDMAVTRKFYSEDLGLEITPEPFNAQFMADNPFVPFNENRPDGWINNQLNEMAREANVEMARLHNANLWVMRERYFHLLAMHCERIRDDLDIHDPSTQYGQLYADMVNEKDDRLRNVDRDVSNKKSELERAWHMKLQEVGVDAARAAQSQFKSRYGKQHDMEVYQIERQVKASIEDDFHDALHDMHERRRTEASQLLDLGITEVLSEISDMYVSALTDERVRYQELQEGMRAFINDNRQADIQRTNALSAELRQREKADQVLAEQTSKIRALTAEYNQKKRDLQNDIQNLRAENQNRIDALKRDHEDDLARVNAERDNAEQRFKDLLKNYQNLDEQKKHEYEARLNEMRNEVSSWESKYNNLMAMHRHNDTVSIFFVIAIFIAAIAIGFIGGSYIRIGNSMKQEQQRILETYSQDPNAVQTQSTNGGE